MQWTNDDIFRVLVRRVATFEGKGMELAAFANMTQPQLAARYLNDVFEESFHGEGLWQNRPMYHVVLSFVRAKPRDIVLFCSGAARMAARNRHHRISSADIEGSLKNYCQGRIDDVIKEFEAELPEIRRLIYGMKRTQREKKESKGNRYSTDELVNKLKDLSSQGKFTFFDGTIASPNDLIRFMFKITFITARKRLPTGFIERKYFDEATHLTTEFADFGYGWEIHPAYRWALDQDDPKRLFRDVDPTELTSNSP
jgi:hypothetical protein